MFEDVFLAAIADRPERQCINDFVSCVGARNIKEANSSKFRMRTFLLLHDPETMQRLNWALRPDLIDPAHPAFTPLRDFLVNFIS